MSTLYLASGSPRRREILENIGYTVIRMASDTDETPHPGEDAAAYVVRMAREKNGRALQLWRQKQADSPEHPVLSADTAVVFAGRILGKPASAQEAAAMLSALSGSSHQVLSAVCVSYRGFCGSVLQSSEVRFAPLSAQQIDAYIRSGEPFDKAGAYGIQGLGGVFVASLQGSFTGVMGLPVFETVGLLRQAQAPVPPFSDLTVPA